MVHTSYPSGGRVRRRKRRNPLLTVALPMAALLALAASPIALLIERPTQDVTVSAAGPAVTPPQEIHVPVPAKIYDRAIVDPKPTLAPQRLNFAHNAPLASAFGAPAVRREAQAVASAPEVQPQPLPPTPPMRVAQADPPVFAPVPLPVPRPADLREPRPAEPAQAARAPAGPIRSAALASAAPSRPARPEEAANNPSFIERLFGIKKPSPPESALGYAALENGTGSIAPRARFNPSPSVSPNDGTAVYDISAQVVVMPNGERLEAHSGLGDKLDDPRFVHVRMRGSTPPGTYILTEREKLFHGVRALRMTPVGGSGAIYGRDGILAHTYMLGPNGDSNGCVSFRNYDRFLQAYLRGEVKRIVVVAGRKLDMLPRVVDSPSPRQRSARST